MRVEMVAPLVNSISSGTAAAGGAGGAGGSGGAVYGGGLVGRMTGTTQLLQILNSYATG